MNFSELNDKINQIAARVKVDELFKQTLLADPLLALKAEGVEMPDCMEVRASVNATGELLLMMRSANGELSDDDLNMLAGGTDIARSSWTWMNGYHVWEANRKVFLYPENRLEPDP